MKAGSARGMVFVLVIVGFGLAFSGPAEATAPHYCTFERRQTLDHSPDAEEVLRIWVVYVGQGDGILVELPPRLSYAVADGGGTERIELLIDAGAYRSSDKGLMTDFLRRRFPEGVPLLEHVVISHHDKDHVAGITHLLGQPDVGVETIYHNGLASYVGGKGLFRDDVRPASGSAVLDWNSKKARLQRGMAFLRPGSDELEAEYLVTGRAALEADGEAGVFQGLYRDFVESILGKGAPRPLGDVVPLVTGAPFVTEREAQRVPAMGGPDGVAFEVLWPPDPPRRFGSWAETINGNSVTFRLRYRDFEMLFTGDHNQLSQAALLERLRAEGRLDALASDVLKVPHHGSHHGVEDFVRAGVRPVLAVASMGEKGFQSKLVGSGAWQHPSTEVIRWLGGAHRVYSTLIHERRFDWSTLDADARDAMIERSSVDGQPALGTHVLIETDGEWFRVVEVSRGADLSSPPTPRDVRRGDGTRWIRARETAGDPQCSTP